MRAAIEKVFVENLAVRAGERVLVITDRGRDVMAGRFLEVARKLGYAAELLTIPIPAVHGAEPPPPVAEKMLASDVILAVTTMSLSHTRARACATENGARIATMSGVSDDILRRFQDVDLARMKARTNALADILDRGSEVLLSSTRGTHLSFSIDGRIAHGRKASIFDRPGYWGNIPCGEAFIAPIEDSVEGRLVVDASIAGIGLLDGDAIVDIRGGKVVDVDGGNAARRFFSMLDDPRKRQVAEFGIGTNDRAQITGTTIEDEKVLGTCHIGFGRNRFFGGTNEVDFHVDCVVRAPTIAVDGRTIDVDPAPQSPE
jgi:leucyl aminopeptidase (aminopeptidase T)